MTRDQLYAECLAYVHRFLPWATGFAVFGTVVYPTLESRIEPWRLRPDKDDLAMFLAAIEAAAGAPPQPIPADLESGGPVASSPRSG